MTKKVRHYKGRRRWAQATLPACLGTRWLGALTQEEFKKIYLRNDMVTTNIDQTTCPACLKAIRQLITDRLGE
jgi:hypothetical protein